MALVCCIKMEAYFSLAVIAVPNISIITKPATL